MSMVKVPPCQDGWTLVAASFSYCALRATRPRRTTSSRAHSQGRVGVVLSHTSTAPSMGGPEVSRPYWAWRPTTLFAMGTQTEVSPVLAESVHAACIMLQTVRLPLRTA